ncbi:MAG TPA: DUF3253 domain-containing protein [Kiloniellales bacterium]|nr:DUF3253 domain-containing protein [Kiloniellales bacterium]
MAEPAAVVKKRDPVAAAILDMLADAGPGGTICPNDVARAIAAQKQKPGDPPDTWRRYLNAVRQQALHLARKGEIAILRKGEPLDPHAPVRGLVKLSLPRHAQS